jgi:hypothetical protein
MIAGGARSFLKRLGQGAVKGVQIFDTVVYGLSGEEKERCLNGGAVLQDFDAAYDALNRLPRKYIEGLKGRETRPAPGSMLLTVDESVLPMLETFEYRHCLFFRLRDFVNSRKYRLLPRMAAVQVCGGWYVAFDTVNRMTDEPVIVSA